MHPEDLWSPEQGEPAQEDNSEKLVFQTKIVFDFDLSRPLDSRLFALGFEGFLISYLDSNFCSFLFCSSSPGE